MAVVFIVWGGGGKRLLQAIVHHDGLKGDVFKIVLKYFLHAKKWIDYQSQSRNVEDQGFQQSCDHTPGTSCCTLKVPFFWKCALPFFTVTSFYMTAASIHVD